MTQAVVAINVSFRLGYKGGNPGPENNVRA